MATKLWQLSATELAACIARRETTARAATESVLARIAEVNPQVNALASVTPDKALQAADAADAAQTRGDALGPLHGVPVTIKINIDVQGEATDEGVHDFKDNIASTDSPLVQSMREAGAIVVGRNNAPAFSLRWFTDNALHGRTLNPFDAGVTPGGSSGGAAVATALGMGAIAHGNDYGGSIRYPAWACGVVGLRTTVGRVPSYKASAPNRIISNQQMSVQGPLTRTVADARLALQVMAQGSPQSLALDPQWVPAPLEFADAREPTRVAVFRSWAHSAVDPTVSAAVDQAAQWLQEAGYTVEEVEPPHFAEVSAMQFQMVMNDMRRAGEGFMQGALHHPHGLALEGGGGGQQPAVFPGHQRRRRGVDLVAEIHLLATHRSGAECREDGVELARLEGRDHAVEILLDPDALDLQLGAQRIAQLDVQTDQFTFIVATFKGGNERFDAKPQRRLDRRRHTTGGQG